MDKKQQQQQHLNINFVSQGSPFLASHRMRVMKPAELLNLCSDVLNATVSKTTDGKAHVNIYNKHFDQKGNLEGVQKANVLGYYSVFDICDDHFTRDFGNYYKLMCQYADVITCNTKAMAERIKKVTGKDAIVINDPISFPYNEPCISKVVEPRCIWYGHGTNVKPLLDWLPALSNNNDKVTAVTNVRIDHEKVDFVPWKPNLVETMIEDYDVVLVPTTQEEWTKCKSPNRVVDAINAGKLVITDDAELYKEFKDFIIVVDGVDSVKEALEFYKEKPEEVKEMITKGQKYITKRYNDGVILDKWLKVFSDLDLIEEVK